MTHRKSIGWTWAAGALATLVLGGALLQAKNAEEPVVEKALSLKSAHVPEVLALLENLTVDPPRTHKSMIVFPLRWSGKQAAARGRRSTRPSPPDTSPSARRTPPPSPRSGWRTRAMLRSF